MWNWIDHHMVSNFSFVSLFVRSRLYWVHFVIESYFSQRDSFLKKKANNIIYAFSCYSSTPLPLWCGCLLLVDWSSAKMGGGASVVSSEQALRDAAKRGGIAKVRSLISEGVDVNATDVSTSTSTAVHLMYMSLIIFYSSSPPSVTPARIHPHITLSLTHTPSSPLIPLSSLLTYLPIPPLLDG